MSKPPTLKDIPDLPEEIIEAGPNGDLVLFVGAGISMLLNLPSWEAFARAVLEDLRDAELLNYAELRHLADLPPRTQLSIAKLVASEAGYALDLTKSFRAASEGTSVYKAINDIGCTCITTNYDELLAPRYLAAADGSATPNPVRRVSEREDLFARYLDQMGTVIHLHGAISKPETMVVTTKEYLEHYDHENPRHFLGELFAKKTVLFLGYGLQENEILEHILRRGCVSATGERRRFALQGFFRDQQPLYERLHQYYSSSFGVHLIGYVRDDNDYRQQENVIGSWAPAIKIVKPSLVVDLARMDEVLKDG
jgi:hypothetical protein